ncbi:MAG: PQQ-binding-like beta-propeller repeat protein [Candidatus Eisenbacteria bacterium]
MPNSRAFRIFADWLVALPAVVAVGVLLLTLALAPATQAQVIDPTFPVTNGLNGHVFLLGDTLYVGGDLTWVGTANGSCVALDASDGHPVAPWPRVQSDFVDNVWLRRARAATPDGSGGCFVAGSFDSVSGVRRFHLAHIRGDGTLDAWNPTVPTSWSPKCLLLHSDSLLLVGGYQNGTGQPLLGAVSTRSGAVLWTATGSGTMVSALATDGTTLYAGGLFTALGGQARSNIAAVDPLTGLATAWNPGADNQVTSLAIGDSAVYAGGTFTHAGGATRTGVVALDPASGAATPWNASLGSAYVNALALAGTTLYVGGSFGTIGGQSRGSLGAIDTRTGQALTWNPAIASQVIALVTEGGVVYVGGSFWAGANPVARSLAAIDGISGVLAPWTSGTDDPVQGLALGSGRLFVVGAGACGGLTRVHAASIEASSGRITDWDPHPDAAIATFASDGSRLLVGGYFAHIAGQPRNGLAAFDRNTGQLLPWDPAAGRPGVKVQHMVIRGRTLYLDGWTGSPYGATALAALDLDTGAVLPWSVNASGDRYFQISSLFALGSRVYILGDFFTVNGVSRRSAAAVDVITGTLSSWNPQLTGWTSAGFPNGGKIYLAGNITAAAGQQVFTWVAVDTVTGAVTGAPLPNVGAPNVVAVDGSTLYTGGSTGTSDPAPYPRTEAHAVDLTTGAKLPWYVGIFRQADPLFGTSSIAERSGEVWLTGDFDKARDAIRHGLAHVLPADGTAPVVTVDAPSDAPLLLGSTYTSSWVATDEQRVLSANLYLSRTGSLGPWELLAGGIEGTSAYAWTVGGPASTDCFLRVEARDLAGNQASATTAAPFVIADTTALLAVGPLAPTAHVALAPPAPTPTRGRATIEYELPARTLVRLALFDLQGREVAMLDQGERDPGRRVAVLDAAGLRPGLYLVRLQAGQVNLHQRLIIIR